jgi:hypothetical protein
MPTEKAKGPASYFPSIEAKYGKSIDHWMRELKKLKHLPHMEQVAHLKTKSPTAHPHVSLNGQLIFFKVQVNSLLQIRVKPPAPFGKTQLSVTKRSAKNK